MPKIGDKRSTKVGKALAKAGAKIQKNRKEPLWKGPCGDGITQSLLSRFLVCPERFRLLMVEGLKPAEGFNQRLEYGNMWHVCEEFFAKGDYGQKGRTKIKSWNDALKEYAQKLCEKYRHQQEQVVHWYNVCKTQFPIYVDYWRKHKDVLNRTPLLSEYSFAVPYQLPSGRTVKLRGKFDSVDLVKTGKKSSIWLMENKTKGDVNEIQLKRQLTFDLQTMLYLVALESHEFLIDGNTTKIGGPNGVWYNSEGELRNRPRGTLLSISGVRYNVVRRPLAGGRHSIKKHQPTKSNPSGESDEEYYDRLGGLIKEDSDYFFMRWNVEITPHDIEAFKTQALNPILERLCDWWEWVSRCVRGLRDPFEAFQTGSAAGGAIHYRVPYGLYNPMLEGEPSDIDHYLATGDETGLFRTENLFPEL